ncbi:MAG TPA: hypothetical protein VGM39_21585 [Kofleriaceae bacterium]|jgi:hypothetical protein
MASTRTLVLAGYAAILLCGCPPPSHYLTADVTMAHTPVAGALVAGECGTSNSAKITNAEGRARLRFYGNVDAGKCVVTVGIPDLPPIESHDASLCTAPDACPALTFDFPATSNATPYVTSQNDRSYRDATPTEIARPYATPPHRAEVAR